MNETYIVNPNIVKADIGTMSLVYLPDKQIFLVLNKTASILLAVLEQGCSRKTLKEAISNIYSSMEKKVIERHVESFLHLVVDHGIALSGTSKAKVGLAEIQLPPPSEKSLDAPIISAYEKKWIIQNHPDAVYDIAFSDTWSPASGGS